jgi:hypothetical protein
MTTEKQMPSEEIAGHFLAHLQERFENQAEWRRGKADEYPHDAIRNLDAARVFDNLAATCKDVSPRWADAYEKACNGPHFEYANQKEHEMMASIWIAYENAEEFVKEVVEHVNERTAENDED